MADAVKTAVFDLGGVLIDWDPRYLYRKLMHGDEEAVEQFLSKICNREWNEKHDAGQTFAEGTAFLKAQYPDKAHLIDAWLPGFDQMMAGPIKDSVAVLFELHDRNVPLYALTNWSAETFPAAQKRFEFLKWFRGIVVSGVEKLIKPDPRIFRLLMDRYSIKPSETVYIDDNPPNVEAARELGFKVIHFTDAGTLRQGMVQLGLL